MKSVRIGFSRAETHSLPSSTILVLGTGAFWTKQTCGFIEGEFDVPCLRFDSIDHAADLIPGLSTLRLVIVDEELAEDLLARPASYFGLSAGASVAFVYRNVDLARAVDRGYDSAFRPMGYLPMRVPVDVWLCALRLLLNHECFLPSDLRAPRQSCDPTAGLVPPPSEAGGRTACNIHALTEREREVLSLASVGDSNKLISRKLAISEHTVKLHMHHVYEKLGVTNRTAAASLFRIEDAAS